MLTTFEFSPHQDRNRKYRTCDIVILVCCQKQSSLWLMTLLFYNTCVCTFYCNIYCPYFHFSGANRDILIHLQILFQLNGQNMIQRAKVIRPSEL